MKLLSRLFALISAAILLMFIGFYIFNVTIYRPGPLATKSYVIIKPGDSSRIIGEKLQKAEVISASFAFIASAFVMRASSKFKPGEYEFEAGVSLGNVISKIRDGRIFLRTINFPEGWTSAQIVTKLNDNDFLSGTIDSIPADGSLYPATYHFYRGQKRSDIIRQMRASCDRIVNKIWQSRTPDLPYANKQELVTMASIIEKETSLPQERSMVAAVFINRLRIGMRLQADPTVIYGIFVADGGDLRTSIFKKDLKRYTPYNTYMVNGLPPAPIANPGVAALKAAANPAKSDALYFVADGSGGHIFADNLKQHQRNVRQWRQIEKQKK